MRTLPITPILAILVSLLTFLPGCESGGRGSKSSAVTGTVWYRERIALPPNSTVEVKLLDVSLAGAPASVVAEQIIASPSGTPVKFSLRYDPARIQEDHRYSVSAQIINRTSVLWVSDASNPVITQGHPTTVDVMVVRATP